MTACCKICARHSLSFLQHMKAAGGDTDCFKFCMCAAFNVEQTDLREEWQAAWIIELKCESALTVLVDMQISDMRHVEMLWTDRSSTLVSNWHWICCMKTLLLCCYNVMTVFLLWCWTWSDQRCNALWQWDSFWWHWCMADHVMDTVQLVVEDILHASL